MKLNEKEIKLLERLNEQRHSFSNHPVMLFIFFFGYSLPLLQFYFLVRDWLGYDGRLNISMYWIASIVFAISCVNRRNSLLKIINKLRDEEGDIHK